MSKKKARKGKPPVKKRLLFDPDDISTQISQALRLDLEGPIHEYGNSNDPVAYAKSRQRAEILKKYCSPKQDVERLEAETFSKFEEVNQHIGRINQKLLLELPWSGRKIQKHNTLWYKVHLRARALMHEILTPLDEDEWFEECQNSSGSSVGVPYKDTSIEAKFTYPLTATKGCLHYWQRYRLFDSTMNRAIQSWNANNPVTDPVRVIDGSRATTVDKTTDKRRMICVEPTLNMFFQQGLMSCLYKRMRSYGLDVETLPDTNKLDAMVSSITGRNATIDWSSASDCVSIMLLQWVLPHKWYVRVWNTRCHSILLKDRWVEPEMISTMGNAVTFPLETLVFWTYAHAMHQTLTEPGNNSMFKQFEHRPGLDSISVFGDDCIVPSFMAEQYVQFMEKIGFLVNSEKSCIGAMQFRESCGGDYLAGFNVRPFMLKSPSSQRYSALEPWLYIIWNRCLKKYITYFGTLPYIYDRKLFRLLIELFVKYKLEIKLVPDYFPDDAGLKLCEDAARFIRHYDVKHMLSRLKRSHYGTYTFQYCRFQYKSTAGRGQYLRYAHWLKMPTVDLRKRVRTPFDDDYHTRDVGGYVVARGISAHWTLPDLSKV